MYPAQPLHGQWGGTGVPPRGLWWHTDSRSHGHPQIGGITLSSPYSAPAPQPFPSDPPVTAPHPAPRTGWRWMGAASQRFIGVGGAAPPPWGRLGAGRSWGGRRGPGSSHVPSTHLGEGGGCHLVPNSTHCPGAHPSPPPRPCCKCGSCGDPGEMGWDPPDPSSQVAPGEGNTGDLGQGGTMGLGHPGDGAGAPRVGIGDRVGRRIPVGVPASPSPGCGCWPRCR